MAITLTRKWLPLEEEISWVVYLCHDYDQNLIYELNDAIKTIKSQLSNDDVPSNADLHAFLDIICDPVDVKADSSAHWMALKINKKDGEFSKYPFMAMDGAFCFVLSQMQQRLSREEFVLTLNGTKRGKSLIAKAVERTLVDSLAILLTSGAIMNPGETSRAVFGTLDDARVVFGSGLNDRVKFYGGRIRRLLDLSTVSTSHPSNGIDNKFLYRVDRETTYEGDELAIYGSCCKWKDTTSLPESTSHLNISRSLEGCLTWIHVPYTNGLITQTILKAALGSLTDMLGDNFHSSAAAPGDPILSYRDVGYWSVPGSDETIIDVIVFPCLALRTVAQHGAARKRHHDILTVLTSASASCNDKPYDSGVHLERTLDEAYFPGLDADELEIRNQDQIASSKYRHGCNVPILIVPQLWLWRVGNVIVSAHCDEYQVQEYMRMKYEHPATRMALLMSIHIRAFGEELKLEDGTRIPSALDLFESFVVSILSQVKKYVEAENRNLIDYDKEAKFHHVLSDCRSELAMMQHFLLQQEDILESFLEDNDYNQATTTSQPETLPKDPANTSNHIPPIDWTPVKKAQAMLKRQQRRVQKIDGDAERIEKNVQDLLNLKRTYASVQDSHASVLLSVAAIGFAVVTIIFAPMGFLVGLFALDFQGFDKLRVQQSDGIGGGVISGATDNQDITVNVATDNNPAYDSGKMAGIFIGTEILTVLVTCLLVWASLRWFGIEFSDFRMGRETKQSAKKKTKRPIQDKTKAPNSQLSHTKTWLRKAWHERSIWKRKKATAAEKGANQA